MRRFIDSATAPIIAIDFDGTININGENSYPLCGEVRPYAKKVINLLHIIGCRIVIWTSRDVAYNQDERIMYDHLSPMLEFLNNNDIKYDAINKSIQFAPYHYNGRKVYAHMYIDDRAYGWNNVPTIMVGVLEDILRNILGMNYLQAIDICECILNGCEVSDDAIKECKRLVREWKK